MINYCLLNQKVIDTYFENNYFYENIYSIFTKICFTVQFEEITLSDDGSVSLRVTSPLRNGFPRARSAAMLPLRLCRNTLAQLFRTSLALGPHVPAHLPPSRPCLAPRASIGPLPFHLVYIHSTLNRTQRYKRNGTSLTHPTRA